MTVCPNLSLSKSVLSMKQRIIRPSCLKSNTFEFSLTGVDLLLAPAIMEVTAPWLNTRPGADLTSLHLDEASLFLLWRIPNRALVLLGSMSLTLVLTVRSTLTVPLICRQSRIGRFRSFGSQARLDGFVAG